MACLERATSTGAVAEYEFSRAVDEELPRTPGRWMTRVERAAPQRFLVPHRLVLAPFQAVGILRRFLLCVPGLSSITNSPGSFAGKVDFMGGLSNSRHREHRTLGRARKARSWMPRARRQKCLLSGTYVYSCP